MQGDERLDPLYRACYPLVLRVCLHHLGDPDDAEDAAQETFRRALQQDLAALDDPQRWLTTVARNLCFDELRRRRTGRTAMRRSAPAGAPAAAVPADDPERVVVGRAFVGDLLGRLTPAERRVVAARLVDDRPGAELAAMLGVAPSTARVLLARGLGKLRLYLADSQAGRGGVVAGAWRGARQLQRALQQRLRLVLDAGGSDGPGFVQGLAALLTAAIATLCLCLPGGVARGQAAPRTQPRGVAHRAVGAPLQATAPGPATASQAHPGAAAPAPAPTAARPPSDAGGKPPKPFQPTDLLPHGSLAQNPSSPGQGIHLVGPVYLEIVPGPGVYQYCGLVPDDGVQVHVGGPGNPNCRALPSI